MEGRLWSSTSDIGTSVPHGVTAHRTSHLCRLVGWHLSLISYSRGRFSKGGHDWNAVGGRCVLRGATSAHRPAYQMSKYSPMHGSRQTFQDGPRERCSRSTKPGNAVHAGPWFRSSLWPVGRCVHHAVSRAAFWKDYSHLCVLTGIVLLQSSSR